MKVVILDFLKSNFLQVSVTFTFDNLPLFRLLITEDKASLILSREQIKRRLSKKTQFLFFYQPSYRLGITFLTGISEKYSRQWSGSYYIERSLTNSKHTKVQQNMMCLFKK